jgi:hypothetical protein
MSIGYPRVTYMNESSRDPAVDRYVPTDDVLTDIRLPRDNRRL